MMATTKNNNSTKNTTRIIHFSNMTHPSVIDLMQQVGRIDRGEPSHDDFLRFNFFDKTIVITDDYEEIAGLHRDLAALGCHSQIVQSAASKLPPLVGSP